MIGWSLADACVASVVRSRRASIGLLVGSGASQLRARGRLYGRGDVGSRSLLRVFHVEHSR